MSVKVSERAAAPDRDSRPSPTPVLPQRYRVSVVLLVLRLFGPCYLPSYLGPGAGQGDILLTQHCFTRVHASVRP